MQPSAQAQHFQQVLTAADAERVIEGLQAFPIADIGSKGWMKQHEDVEKLNAQAQISIMTQSDEFVVETLIDREKIPTIIFELLAIEAWKEKVLPVMIQELAAEYSVKAYFMLYHEALLVGLLEKTLFHVGALEAGGECLMELADYCYRRLAFLTTIDPETVGEGEATSEALEEEAITTLNRQHLNIQFGVGISALTLVRFLTENTAALPLGVLTRLLEEQDVLYLLVALLEQPPWRRARKGKMEKFSEGRWSVVDPSDFAKLSKTEAQVWLAINNLMCDVECRKKYNWDEHKKANVSKLTKFMNEVLLDQLPLLADLRRTLDQINIMQPPEAAGSALLIEQVPEMRTQLLASIGDPNEMARHIISRHLVMSAEDKRQELARLAQVYGANDFEEFMEDPKCSACGKPAEKRCSRCKSEWYCGRECQVGAWKKHKPLCDVLAAAKSK